MSGEQRAGLFDHSRSASGRDLSRGSHYVVRVSASETNARWVRGRVGAATLHGRSRSPVPEAKVSKTGRVTFSAGGDMFAAARQLGHGSVPVAMTMASARAAHKAGLLDPGHGLSGSSRHPRQFKHQSAVHVVVDLTDMNRVAKALGGVAMELKQQHTAISRAINYGIRRLQTDWKRKVKAWTGLKSEKPFAKAFRQQWSTPSFLSGSLSVKSGHMVVTRDYFGASWSRSNPGATHRAWGRQQIAVGTFMAPGHKPVFHRTTSARLPIVPLWGPNIAREIDRHRPEVEASVQAVGARVSAEAARVLAVAVAKAKA
jgi:hypothetical protein